MDFGKSDDPRVQAQLERLSALSVPQGRLGLETITALMERLGNPHRKLPPVFHVAGTNGKGSVCAFLRAMLEADGKRVHVTTSPHLVRYNERIRIAGRLIDDGPLADLLKEVLDAGEDLAPSFFEVTIAAAFLAFSRTPADACVVEVGLGGRFDATNVLEPGALAACGIAALGLDHERFLLAPEEGVPKEPMARIAFEKAGIAKKGVPLVTMDYGPVSNREIVAASDRAGAPLKMMHHAWDFRDGPTLAYQDAGGRLNLPVPRLPGRHQFANAALAVAMLRNQGKVTITTEALAEGIVTTRWPARMQILSKGPLIGERTVWLDGGHNPNAGAAIAEAIEGPLHLILGMLDNKNPRALLDPFGDRVRTLQVVPVPDHDCHPASAFGEAAVARKDLENALLNVPPDGSPILIAGSLYLAGEALRLNDEIPD
ncbi:bifunctional folylpolyglutamate synthase/dihydrofolate synthase [Erythrobacter sp. SCSIO 43205]|uniref:bifunctional folylpolyglutamate synthase/dihydrofolate synthase n=1 Tax=Erythrobacter sp. SCSIO 43205 TaxID=2779361 RepID=UPI001CA85250|nr:folylpolyglutamate synthase/dihydrofolate synthase family protein [Erythrobacter sp. SCSIO 43205]UAB77399.1 bifunctional folylpolyglutamate synthase/dihydrofolate synthase [Erythrobacter sp. SCSIO 43205]